MRTGSTSPRMDRFRFLAQDLSPSRSMRDWHSFSVSTSSFMRFLGRLSMAEIEISIWIDQKLSEVNPETVHRKNRNGAQFPFLGGKRVVFFLGYPIDTLQSTSGVPRWHVHSSSIASIQMEMQLIECFPDWEPFRWVVGTVLVFPSQNLVCDHSFFGTRAFSG